MDRKCEKIDRKVDKIYQQYFIDESDVLSIMTEGNRKIIKGTKRENIDLKKLEDLLQKNKFIKEAKVSINLEGDLDVEVTQNTPIARIYGGKESFYIDQEGNKLPLSPKYTARVPIIVSEYKNVDKKNNFFASKEGESYLILLNYIRKDDFWSKQISEIGINKIGELDFLMQVGKQKIEFGFPDEIDSKFFRLNVLVKKVLPSVGWSKYKRVSLKYKDQIVCE